MKKMLIASTSTLHGGTYLDYLLPEIEKLFQGCKLVVFIPYARPGGITHEAYTQKARDVFGPMGIVVKGIHEFDNPLEAIDQADGFFTGGGNTFLLVTQLYRHGLMIPLADAIKSGKPYMGSSAGSNITGLTMQTTNDMPIVYPPDFRTLALIPFNLNPHYLDPEMHSKHMGETRETRIREFHQFNAVPVLGLREGSWIEVSDGQLLLRGELSARLFRQGMEPEELAPGTDLSFIH